MRHAEMTAVKLNVALDPTGQEAPRDALFPDPVKVIRPAQQLLPVVLSSPHSGRDYPELFLSASRLDATAIRRSEDSFVDELFAEAARAGAPLLAAIFPRAYLDVNREPYELDPSMFTEPLPAHANTRSLRVSAGLGTIARVVREGAEIYKKKLSVAEAERRIRALYVPYHEGLRELIEATAAKFGHAILLDCHSMPSIGAAGERDFGHMRADLVLGDRYGAACSAIVMRAAESTLSGLGYRVSRNQPYAGGFSTEHYGRPRIGLHALQIEINRALYMDEDRFELTSGLTALSADMAKLVRALAALPAAELRGIR
jgi:N-formylglutamate amidohydrolase